MKHTRYPTGWNEERVRLLLQIYETQTEEEAVVEDESAFRRRDQTGGRFFTAALALCLLVTACVSTQERRIAGQAALDSARTLLEVTQLVGIAPSRCLPLTSSSQLCTWQVNNRMPGYSSLAGIANTDHIVYLVCDLPTDNTARRENSCQVRAVPD